MKIPKILWTLLGCVGLALGAVGVVLPMLPAFLQGFSLRL